MIKFGIRQSFDNIEQVEERFSKLDAPVELALPYYWDIYEPVRGHLRGVADKIRAFHVEVLSIHAVQAPITDERFMVWGKEIADFASMINVKTITLHPNNVNKDKVVQEKALKNLEYLADLCKNEIIFCIETFTGKRRVFTPDEIVEFNLPMTLDTTHIKDDKRIWHLLRNYRNNIMNVHLSAKEEGKQHLPIDSFCKEVVSFLIQNKWGGNVILEYLFEFHDQMLNDLKLLKAMQ